MSRLLCTWCCLWCLCPFHVWCHCQDPEFCCSGTWLPYCLFIYFESLVTISTKFIPTVLRRWFWVLLFCVVLCILLQDVSCSIVPSPLPWCLCFTVLFDIWSPRLGKREWALTQSHLKPKVTVRQFSGYRKIKSIYVKTMLLFKVIGGMAIILNSYDRKR